MCINTQREGIKKMKPHKHTKPQKIPPKHQKKTCQKAFSLELGRLFVFIPLSNTFRSYMRLEMKL